MVVGLRLRRLTPHREVGGFAVDFRGGRRYGPVMVGWGMRVGADASADRVPGAATGFPVRAIFVDY